VGEVLPRDPVDRRIEMRAGVFAETERVPVPRGPAGVVARDTLDRQTRRRRERRRQADDGRRRPERLREVDDLKPAGEEILDEVGQRVRSHLWNSNRFSRSARSVTKADGPTASTFATSVVKSRAVSASAKPRVNSSIVRTVAVRGTPAAAAMPARSLRVEVAVGKPPTDSRLSLSNTTCTRLRGRYRASVVSPPRFIRIEPSPSKTTTCLSGRASAMPSPIDDASPIACW